MNGGDTSLEIQRMLKHKQKQVQYYMFYGGHNNKYRLTVISLSLELEI